ncbi:alpha/beta hydrolase [Candidatus Pacearchaeota archaeon]|nr:alpha/beta hydrolase [Candidatus Pacearchaeota archaeon]
MEKKLKIKTSDSKLINGTFVATKQKTNTLVVFVHGFTGNRNVRLIYNGAKFFTKKGFDTFRFDLYGKNKGSRRFRDTKISLHGEDITIVLKYFRKKYKNIYVVGHSYGGTSLLFTDQSIIDGFVFWDASYVESTENNTAGMRYSKELDAYILGGGVETVIGKEFVEELKNFSDCGELIKKINKPVLFVTAGKKGNSKAGKKYFIKANNPKKLINIKTANHNFDNWNDEETLFRETYGWLRKVTSD